MTSFDELQVGIAAANDKATESLGALQHAHALLEQAQAMMQQVSVGSDKPDVSETNGLLARAVDGLVEVRQYVTTATQSAENVAARL